MVRAYYTLTAVFTLSASLIWGVNTLFLLDAGLTIFQAFVANAAFTAGQVIFEIPTGVVADTRGRRLSFLLSAITLLIGTLWYIYLAATGGAFVWWLAASVLLGLGFTFYSGAVEAWFVDALEAVQGKKELDPYFARGGQVFGASMLVGTIGGGLLGQIDLALPFAVRSVLLWVLFVAGFYLMKDLGFKKRRFRFSRVPQEMAAITSSSWKYGWKNRHVRLLMMMTFLQSGFMIWGWYAWQPYFLQLLDRELIWVAGVIAAGLTLSMMVGNQIVHVLQGKVSRPALLVAGSAVLAACMVGVGIADSFALAVALFLLGAIAMGVTGPSKQSALHAHIPSRQRATIISFDGLLGSAGGVVSQPTLARVAQDQGYGMGYIIGGSALALAVPLAVVFRRVEGRDGVHRPIPAEDMAKQVGFGAPYTADDEEQD